MDTDTEINEGAIVIGISPRTQTECMFEVKIIKGWAIPLAGSLYTVTHPMGGSEICLTGIEHLHESTLADIAVFRLSDCMVATPAQQMLYNEMPGV